MISSSEVVLDLRLPIKDFGAPEFVAAPITAGRMATSSCLVLTHNLSLSVEVGAEMMPGAGERVRQTSVLPKEATELSASVSAAPSREQREGGPSEERSWWRGSPASGATASLTKKNH